VNRDTSVGRREARDGRASSIHRWVQVDRRIRDDPRACGTRIAPRDGMNRVAAVVSTALLLGLGSIARADPPPQSVSASRARHAFGVRFGGYGFRNTEHAGLGHWDDCPMDGLGLFAQRTLSRHLFAEAGFDLYTARNGTPTAEMPVVGMDRISAITTIAAGARIPWRWVSPYVQIGLGLEVTRVEMPAHELRESAVQPMGFLGFGAELRITRQLAFGANARTNVMVHYDHGGAGHSHDGGAASLDGAAEEMTGEYEAAAQGQIFVRYEL
jgi:hypothetical protein